MYTKFFGFKRRPFILSPDPDFLYLSRVHDLAFTHLEYGIVHNAGFIALTGDVGAGKTTLLNYLFEKVKDSLNIAMLFNTNLGPQEFLEMLVKEFELNSPTKGKSDLFETLSEHFLKQYTKGERCIIMVDEAQNLSLETFEELRMLSNLEIGSDFLLQIILVGQPQLRERLAHPSLSQLTQRISVYFHLSALAPEEVENYIGHRLKVAGYNSANPIFARETVKYIAELSRGIPRIINSICDMSLTHAFADGVKFISREMVKGVIDDNQLLLILSEGVKDVNQDAGSLSERGASLPASMDLNVRTRMAGIYERLERLEKRINAVESAEKDGLVGILQTMLSKEHEKTLDLEHQIVIFDHKYKELEKELQVLKGRTDKKEYKKKNVKFWEVLGGKK
jgi:general secretion pathway protein A